MPIKTKASLRNKPASEMTADEIRASLRLPDLGDPARFVRITPAGKDRVRFTVRRRIAIPGTRLTFSVYDLGFTQQIGSVSTAGGIERLQTALDDLAVLHGFRSQSRQLARVVAGDLG